MHARITGWSRAVSVMLLTSLCLACMGGGVREAKPEVVVEKQSSIAGLYKVEAMSGSASEHPRVTFSQVGQVELPADDKRITNGLALGMKPHPPLPCHKATSNSFE